jgi:hypothetical protein
MHVVQTSATAMEIGMAGDDHQPQIPQPSVVGGKAIELNDRDFADGSIDT